MSGCALCPRICGADRFAGRLGYCGAGSSVRVFRYGSHHGEEPPISGTAGSGTVFFSHCTLKCVYCQNYRWSQSGAGTEYATADLARILAGLRAEGCHNWNLVTPTPWLPQIRQALKAVRAEGLSLPVVYNTSGFERPETLAEYRDVADVFLTDLRYSRESSAQEGSGCGGYVEAARQAFLQMWSLAGPLELDGSGLAVRGVICRLLILPGHAREAVENLQWLADCVGTQVSVSVMAQYTPAHRAISLEGWDRPILRSEYDEVCEALESLGFTQGWVQEFGEKPPTDLIGFEMESRSLAGT